MYYCEVCQATQSFECCCDDLDMERDEKTCPMITQLTQYLNSLEEELDKAENSYNKNKDKWFQLLVLRGERVSIQYNIDCSFYRTNSGYMYIIGKP